MRIMFLICVFLSFASVAYAATPSFDCKKASGQVEELICKDDELAGLDNLMAKVFAESEKKASSEKDPEQIVAYLKTYQRGWAKGRNECWKATEGNAIRECVVTEYERRISELQAFWDLNEKSEAGRLLFTCDDKDRTAFYLTAYKGTPLPAALIEHGGVHEAYVATRTASGVKYEGDFGKYVWNKGDQAFAVFNQNQPGLKCRLSEDVKKVAP